MKGLGPLARVAPLLAAASCASQAADEGVPQADGPRMSFVLEVDRALAREQVWLLRDANDEQVVTVAMNAVRRRLDAMARSVELQHVPGSSRFEAILPAGGDHEVESVGRKHLGKGLADPGRGACDQRGS